jgi:hypothetical protein
VARGDGFRAEDPAGARSLRARRKAPTRASLARVAPAPSRLHAAANLIAFARVELRKEDDMKRTAIAAAALVLAGTAQAEMTIFKQPNFTGNEVTVRDAARDLAPLGITDQASSLVIRSGRWEVCTQPDYQGDCRTLEAGRYATLDPSLNHRIESVREVRQSARRDDGRYSRRSYDSYSAPEDRGWRDRNGRDDRDWQDRGAYDPRYDSRDWSSPYGR